MIKKARTKLIGERCILMTIFGDKIRKLRIEKKWLNKSWVLWWAFLIEQFELGKLKDDIRSRVVYIKNWQMLYLTVEPWPMRTKLFSWMRWRDFIWHQKRTEENGKKKWTVLFSCLIEKKNRTYNSVNDPEIFTLEIELFAPVVRV